MTDSQPAPKTDDPCRQRAYYRWHDAAIGALLPLLFFLLRCAFDGTPPDCTVRPKQADLVGTWRVTRSDEVGVRNTAYAAGRITLRPDGTFYATGLPTLAFRDIVGYDINLPPMVKGTWEIQQGFDTWGISLRAPPSPGDSGASGPPALWPDRLDVYWDSPPHELHCDPWSGAPWPETLGEGGGQAAFARLSLRLERTTDKQPGSRYVGGILRVLTAAAVILIAIAAIQKLVICRFPNVSEKLRPRGCFWAPYLGVLTTLIFLYVFNLICAHAVGLGPDSEGDLYFSWLESLFNGAFWAVAGGWVGAWLRYTIGIRARRL